jgi:phage N-6-adenine-methyltransferase
VVAPVMFSSATDEWETPQAFFDKLNDEFGFVLDAAANRNNAKCAKYLGPDQFISRWQDGLTCPWDYWVPAAVGEYACAAPVVWCNPPYSRGMQAKFIAKAAEERKRGVASVMLLPARTDTKAFHTHIYDASKWQPREGIEIRLLPGRLKFGGAANSAPFPSMVVVFRP